MSNPNKIHYSRGYTNIGGIQFNPKLVVAVILVLFSLYAVYKYGQFAAEKNFNMALDVPRGKVHVEHLSWNPRVFYHHNFLSDNEISYFLTGLGNTSTGSMRAWSGNGDWFDSVLKRIARFTQEPVANFEQGFFYRYATGGDTDTRRDWFKDDESEMKGSRGNRVATLIIFLSNAKAEYYFPKANLRITPRLGDAILIWNLTPDHRIDELAQYAVQKIGSPLTTYTTFIRERPAAN